MTTTKTNQPTCNRDAFLIMKDLDMARAMDETEAVARLSAELKQSINLIFTGNAPEIRAIETVTLELAHREALAEDAKRNEDVPQVCIINPEIDKEMFDTMRAEDRLNVGAYSSPRVYVDNPEK